MNKFFFEFNSKTGNLFPFCCFSFVVPLLFPYNNAQQPYTVYCIYSWIKIFLIYFINKKTQVMSVQKFTYNNIYLIFFFFVQKLKNVFFLKLESNTINLRWNTIFLQKLDFFVFSFSKSYAIIFSIHSFLHKL